MIDNFVLLHKKQVLSWVHLPTLDFEEARDELLLSVVAWGAANARYPEIRRLGLAMQETARTAIAEMFEEDNRNTRDLRAMQTNGLHLHVGLWSGVRRKIEIAQSFMLPFVTMLRRGGRFRTRGSPPTEPNDDAATTKAQWEHWVECESMKRLAYHAFLEDTCISMALFNPPMINPLEILLELPCSRAIWDASSPDEWKQLILSRKELATENAPTLRTCCGDISILTMHQEYVDVQMSFLLIVCSVWARIWHWRQMRAAPTQSGNQAHNLSVSSYHQELTSYCHELALSEMDLAGGIEPFPKMFLEMCQLHLYVSLEDIQTFAGKEGHEEARKMVASLRTSWIKLPESRYAIYHAGQVLRQASRFPLGFLTGVAAVAVYHAGLVLWTYAVLAEPDPLLQYQNARSSTSQTIEPVQLDGAHSFGDFQRFFLLGKGWPCIYSYQVNQDHDESIIPLTDPSAVMGSITNLLANKNGAEFDLPPIVTNLVKLMQSLGKAAREVGRISG